MMSDLARMLSGAEVFGKFTASEREGLSRLATRRALARGTNLCLQGEPWPYVFLVVSGTLKSMIASPDGRIYVVSRWERGDEFWGHTIFDGEGMPSTTDALEDTVGYQWQGEDVLRYMFRSGIVMRALLCRQTRLIRRRRENIYNLAFNPVANRLASLLIDKFRDAEGPTVQRDLTLEEMAAMVATSPEVVCRVLYQFQDNGYLQVDRATITLHDRNALENLVIHD
jgi:CRP-like cAMP-binding protein